MNLAKWAKNRIEKNRRSRRGISTIMANLTMLVIVVSLSSLLFVWAISSFGAYQGGAGYWFSSRSIANQERVSVENVYFGSSIINIYVRNVGTIPFTVVSLYLNGTQSSVSRVINVTQVYGFSMVNTITGSAPAHGDIQKVTVATSRGTVVTTTWVS
jgi:accessory gene regulator protein AgrB